MNYQIIFKKFFVDLQESTMNFMIPTFCYEFTYVSLNSFGQRAEVYFCVDKPRDATLLMNDLYYPLIGSTCFGLSPVHHQSSCSVDVHPRYS